MLVLSLVAGVGKHFVKAETTSELTDRRNQLQKEIDAGNQVAKDLGAQADSLQKKLNELNVQIGQINKEIEMTTLRIEELGQKLDQTTQELERQKSLLRASMKELYVTGDASTIEMLANSDNFGEFVNEQKYLEQLKAGIEDSTKRVIELKKQIEEQKLEQEKLKVQQEAQKQQLATAQAEQANLLEVTKGEEAKYKEHVANLQKQQAAINAELASRLRARGLVRGGTGGYPYNDVPYPCWSGSGCADPWGMFKRECVSYTAWKVWSTGKNMPFWGGRGNANQWPTNASAAGFQVDSSPTAGDVAISLAGPYGHAMYVEHVNGDGSIYVSQYNFGWDGEYSEMTINSTGLVFITFPNE